MHPAIEALEKPSRKPEPKKAPQAGPALANAATPSTPVVIPCESNPLVDEVDAILACAARGEQLTDSDLSRLERFGLVRGLDKEREIDRVRTVLRSQEKAGTREERAALKADIEQAEREEAEQAPEIERKIEDLKRRRALLAKAPEAAREKLRQMQAAVEDLKLLRRMPQCVVDEYRDACRISRDRDSQLSRRREDVATYNRVLEAADSGAQEVTIGHTLRTITPELIEAISKEREQAVEDVASLKRMYDAQIADRDQILNRYVR